MHTRTRIREPGIACTRRRDNTGLADERIRQRGLAVIDVRNHRHVAHVRWLVHHQTHLLHREVDLVFVTVV